MCGGRDLGFAWARSRGGSWGSAECLSRDGGTRRTASDFLLCHLGPAGSHPWEGAHVVLGRYPGKGREQQGRAGDFRLCCESAVGLRHEGRLVRQAELRLTCGSESPTQQELCAHSAGCRVPHCVEVTRPPPGSALVEGHPGRAWPWLEDWGGSWGTDCWRLSRSPPLRAERGCFLEGRPMWWAPMEASGLWLLYCTQAAVDCTRVTRQPGSGVREPVTGYNGRGEPNGIVSQRASPSQGQVGGAIFETAALK